MQRRLLLVAVSAAFLLIYGGVGCTKLDTTTLGSDLVTVDNINTFADTLSVNATQGIFNDSTILQKSDNHAIGAITTDNLFGSTDARIYVQFKPTFYPFYFGNAGDTVNGIPAAGLDSAFVCLSYRGAWGDTSSNTTQTFEVRAIIDDDFRRKTDTIRQLGGLPPTVDNNNILGTAYITPATIAQKVFLGRGLNKDSVTNQIRIKLTGTAGTDFAALLFNGQDTISSSINNGFLVDSNFRKKYNGFEIRVKSPINGNTLYYVNLGDAKSRLEFHYRKTKAGVKDTVVQSFQMYTSQVGNIAASSSMNYIKRDYTTASSPLPTANQPTNNVFIQTAPGTFASLSIPGLTGYTNRIVHRAYLIVEQTPDNAITDKIYTAPPFLYLDLKDTTTPVRYKPVYFDLGASIPYNPDATSVNAVYHPYPFGNVNVQTFGGFELKRFEPAGTAFSRYEINITRYVQHIVSNGFRNYDLRLYAPFNYYYPQYPGTQYIIPYFNPIALGRVRVGSGSNSNHRMKVVVVYSKI
ncbi:MAG: hypothetical protein ACKVOM_07930 [Ferruginibacter sp.]